MDIFLIESLQSIALIESQISDFTIQLYSGNKTKHFDETNPEVIFLKKVFFILNEEFDFL